MMILIYDLFYILFFYVETLILKIIKLCFRCPNMSSFGDSEEWRIGDFVSSTQKSQSNSEDQYHSSQQIKRVKWDATDSDRRAELDVPDAEISTQCDSSDLPPGLEVSSLSSCVYNPADPYNVSLLNYLYVEW